MNDAHIESATTIPPLYGGYKNKRHGHWCGGKPTSEYSCWNSMKARCLNPNWHQYARYGGRGITICERWMSFDNFIADMGLKPSPKHELDRRDNNGNYEPSNCYWATRIQQQRNTSYNVMLTFRGETRCAAEWAEILGFRPATITQRILRGWTVEEALGRPPIRSARR